MPIPPGLSQYLMIGKLVALLAAIALICFQSSQIHRWHTHYDAEHEAHLHDNAAFSATVAGYRVAAQQAKAADKANALRVAAEQAKINQETSNEYEARLAAARAVAGRLRAQAGTVAADPGSRSGTPVPGVHAPASGPAQASGEDGFSIADRLIATEQAIQLDELIKWVKKQAGVEVNDQTASNPAPAASSREKPATDLPR